MRRRSNWMMYAVAAALCVTGIILTIIGDSWDGNAPLSQLHGSNVNVKGTVPPAQANVSLDQRLSASATPDSVITANTSIFWVTRYTKCGHERVREDSPDPEMIGKTFSDFAKLYPDCTLEIVGGQLRMVTTYDQYCPDHYIIKSDSDGSIYVYRNMEGKGRLTVVMKMNFTVDSVPQDYKPLLKDGMAFGSIEEIEGLIESAET